MRTWADHACPQCHQRDSEVIDSRGTEENGIRRRRRCARCGHRYTTRERIEAGHQRVAAMDRIEDLLAEAQTLLATIRRKKQRSNPRYLGARPDKTSAA